MKSVLICLALAASAVAPTAAAYASFDKSMISPAPAGDDHAATFERGGHRKKKG